MDKKKVKKIFEYFREAEPNPKTELESVNDFTLLVAIILSAQSTDVGVNKATKPLFKIVKNAKDILDLGHDGLIKYIKTIGLYNSKAKNIMKMADIMHNQLENKMPRNVEDLQKLPGVGRKTANVFLNCAYGMKTMGVDTHVFRVGNRLGLTKSKNPLQTEKQLLKIIPEEFKLHAHHWLILHGRYVCKARTPLCPTCKLSLLCDFYHTEAKASE